MLGCLRRQEIPMRADIAGLKQDELRTKLKSLAEQDRLIVSEILLHLQIVEKNYYYALWGFSSIQEYSRVELGFSESEAQLRVSSMRAMAEMPEIETQIKSGEITLSN